MVFYKGGNMFEKITDFLMQPENDWILLIVLFSLSALMGIIIYFVAKKKAEKELKGLDNVKK